MEGGETFEILYIRWLLHHKKFAEFRIDYFFLLNKIEGHILFNNNGKPLVPEIHQSFSKKYIYEKVT